VKKRGRFEVQASYVPRHVTEAQLGELINLWHLGRTALAGGDASSHRRMIWASRQFHDAHPEVSESAAYKDLSNALWQP
jgi:DNA-binding GntR family transcriptional regulator